MCAKIKNTTHTFIDAPNNICFEIGFFGGRTPPASYNPAKHIRV